jgi:hypothetical protein
MTEEELQKIEKDFVESKNNSNSNWSSCYVENSTIIIKKLIDEVRKLKLNKSCKSGSCKSRINSADTEIINPVFKG